MAEVMADATVTVTIVPLNGEAAGQLAAACLPLLSGPEILRARSIDDDRQRTEFILCHRAIQCLAAKSAGGRPVSYVRGPSGRPLLPSGPHLSVSRAGGFAAIGLCQAHALGVDLASLEAEVDVSSRNRYPGLARRMRSAETCGKLSFLRSWTELEAIAKLRQIPMHRLLAEFEPDPPVLCTFSGQRLILTVAVGEVCTVSLQHAEWNAGFAEAGGNAGPIATAPNLRVLRSSQTLQ